MSDFRLTGAETLESAVDKSFRALYMDNWDEVKRELVKHIRTHYVPREVFNRAVSGKPVPLSEREIGE